MKIVLLENIKNIGQKGEVKEVKNGYAMNFLIPQKKASPATEENVKQAKLDQVKKKGIAQNKLEQNKTEAEKINGQKIILKTKTQNKKLFGALSESNIREALLDAKINLVNGKLNISEPIKTTGEHQIEVNWGADLKAKFILIVEGEK